ncbi:lysozyme [Paragemmobacter straminiformis]|uniref:lysozyme n=1 Tax=Paragemmobacter straminiformis TaxID=2045119 RepID=UPI003BAE2E1D
MRTSQKGLAALELEDGMVLRSYLCPAGKWTIGPGITSAAGVGKVGPRMQITLDQARVMTEQALAKNYEPTVNAVMGRANQWEFDAGSRRQPPVADQQLAPPALGRAGRDGVGRGDLGYLQSGEAFPHLGQVVQRQDKVAFKAP